jgi:hypothetical protein
MATKHTINGKAQVYQASRELEKRAIFIGSNWTQVRIGFIGCMVPAANDDTASLAEDVNYDAPPNDRNDWFSFGLANNSTYLPGTSGSRFVGASGDPDQGVNSGLVRNHVNSSGTGFVGQAGDYDYGGFQYVSWNGSSSLSNIGSSGWSFNYPVWAADGRGGLFAFKFVVNNKGLSSQTISISNFSDGVSQAVTPANALYTMRSLLTRVGYTTAGTVTWNSGGVALPLPDTWFLRSSFINNRIRWAVKYGMLIS